jgi:hypothetical protein
MATDSRKQSPKLIRYRHPRVVPLELWDLWIGKQILWDAIRDPDFPRILREALINLRAGGGATRSDGPVPPEIRGFDALWLGGGGCKAALRKVLRDSPFPVYFAETEAFAGERGGLALLAREGCAGCVVDLGQTQLKISAAGKRSTFARDFEALPVRDDDAECDHPEQRLRLREFIACSLCECGAQPEAVVFALPARLSADGEPEGSSYIGLRGDVQLVPDALALAGLAPRIVFLLNDAELAALSALADVRVSPAKRTLVLTVGFGLGAALLLPA